MFDCQDKSAPDIPVQESRPATIPRTCDRDAIVTEFGGSFIFAKQGNATFVAGKSGDKGRPMPAGRAKPVFACHRFLAIDALGWKYHPQEVLHSATNALGFATHDHTADSYRPRRP